MHINNLYRCVTFLLSVTVLCFSGSTTAVELIGFVPDYRMNSNYINNTLSDQLAMLDSVAYFGISVDFSGNLNTTSADLNNIATIKQKIDALPVSQRPRLDITIGGAGEDAVFSNIANTSAERAQFAQDLDALLDQTGAGGVQIDWEHPDPGIERSTYYPALLKRVKQEFGANRTVGATVAPSVILSNSVFSGSDAVDSISLMSYDLGWWGNDPSNPNTGEHSLQEYAEDASQAWTDSPGSPNQRPWVFGSWGNNAPANKIGVGLPFYGRNISNGTAYTYNELFNGGTTSDGNYYSYLGQNVWIPGLDLVQERVEFAEEQDLHNVIIWELAQDLHPSHASSMLRRAYETKISLAGLPGDYDGNGSVGTSDYTVWLSSLGQSGAGMAADGNDDQIINQADYDIWISNYGNTMDGELLTITKVIPEPATAVLLIMLVAFFPLCYSRTL